LVQLTVWRDCIGGVPHIDDTLFNDGDRWPMVTILIVVDDLIGIGAAIADDGDALMTVVIR